MIAKTSKFLAIAFFIFAVASVISLAAGGKVALAMLIVGLTALIVTWKVIFYSEENLEEISSSELVGS